MAQHLGHIKCPIDRSRIKMLPYSAPTVEIRLPRVQMVVIYLSINVNNLIASMETSTRCHHQSH